MRTYNVRKVHRVAPSDRDVSRVELPDGCFSDRKTLARALRETGVLHKGQSVVAFRVEGDRVVAFPTYGTWHSFIISEAS